jgi:uncharacterized protein YodC (DUF2158 family)
MSDSLKYGDVVMLKSGGPEMTVAYKGNDAGDKFGCYWFDRNDVKEHVFPAEALKKIEPQKK